MEEPIDFIAEAKASLSDVSFALQYGELSKNVSSDCTVAYINLTTRENDHFCVKLNSCGFQVITVNIRGNNNYYDFSAALSRLLAMLTTRLMVHAME